jgi:hypothetical protein
MLSLFFFFFTNELWLRCDRYTVLRSGHICQSRSERERGEQLHPRANFFSLHSLAAEESERKEKKNYLSYLNDKRIEKHHIISIWAYRAKSHASRSINRFHHMSDLSP